jgi:hypothetical protein
MPINDLNRGKKKTLLILPSQSQTRLAGKNIIYRSGWWFGTFFIFPYIGNNHPN